MTWEEVQQLYHSEWVAAICAAPSGKVVSKEQYDYILEYGAYTGIDCFSKFTKTFDEVKGQYLQIGFAPDNSAYFYFAPNLVWLQARAQGHGLWMCYCREKAKNTDFSYGRHGEITFEVDKL